MKKHILHYKNLLPFLRGRLPGQLVIQYSSKCNADCLQCGMRRSAKIKRSQLSIEYCRKLIDDAAQKGVKALSLTGGEPLMFIDDIVELINYAGQSGIPCVRTGTNGFLFCNPESNGFENRVNKVAKKLGSTNLYTFWISLDSADPDVHESIRGLPGVVEGIRKALPIFHEHGIFPSVNLGINRATGGKDDDLFLHKLGNREFLNRFKLSFERFFDAAIELGFTSVNSCYPMSNGDKECRIDSEVYGAVSSDDIIHFGREEKALIFQALFETIPKYRGRIRIFSPRCSIYNLVHKYKDNSSSLFPCRGGHDFFFVDSDRGKITPCGYLPKEFFQLPDLKKRNCQYGEFCELCDWECFRDPSDLMGIFAEFFITPMKTVRKVVKNKKYFSILKEDLKYYHACGYFNGRVPPDITRMSAYSDTVIYSPL